MEKLHLHLHSALAISGLSIAMVMQHFGCVEAVDGFALAVSFDADLWHPRRPTSMFEPYR